MFIAWFIRFAMTNKQKKGVNFLFEIKPFLPVCSAIIHNYYDPQLCKMFLTIFILIRLKTNFWATS